MFYRLIEFLKLSALRKLPQILACIILCLYPYLLHAQQNNDAVPPLPANILDKVSERTIRSINGGFGSLEKKLARSTEKYLARLHRQEEKLKKKIAAKDSLAAANLFGQTDKQYNKLLQQLQSPANGTTAKFMDYIPSMDSLQTLAKLFEKTGAGIPGMPAEKLAAIQGLSSQLTSLQGQINNAIDVKKFISERKQQLMAGVEKLGFVKQLKAFNKEAYYYQQQLNEYKEMLHDPEKMAQKLLAIARNMPAFRDFFSKNSQLAQLFPLQGGNINQAALQGLQTRAGVQQQLMQQAGVGGGNPQQFMQQQAQQAQSQLNALKEKINKAGGGSSDLEMPDFKPNTQRTKSFWRRLELGLNIQSQKPNGWLPVTSDIAFSVGYKLNDKSVIGLGAGYKLGWGSSIDHIKLTSQGMSLRSFLDMKLKGSFWISGGFEYNYQHEFTKIDQLANVNAWQESGLIGLTKKYKIGKKGGNLQLLWDFLSYNQVPKTQPLKFRIGYTF